MQSGSEQSGIQENHRQLPRGSFYVAENIETSTICADTPASAARLAATMLIYNVDFKRGKEKTF